MAAAAGAGVFVVCVGGCCLDDAYTGSIRHLTRVSHATIAGYQSGHCAMPVHDSIPFTTMLNSHDLYSTLQVQTTDPRAIIFWKLAYISHRLREKSETYFNPVGIHRGYSSRKRWSLRSYC